MSVGVGWCWSVGRWEEVGTGGQRREEVGGGGQGGKRWKRWGEVEEVVRWKNNNKIACGLVKKTNKSRQRKMF